MRTGARAFWGIAGILSCATGLDPCDCVPVSASTALTDPETESVFRGAVLAIEETEVQGPVYAYRYFRVTFAVRAVWKGPVAETVDVLTPQEGTACGADFTRHGDYLVFAYRLDSGLETNSCSSYPTARDSPLLAELGEPLWSAEEGSLFRRGDVNTSRRLDIGDAIRALNFLFLGGAAPECLDAADIDDSGGVLVTDAVLLLEFLFLGGEPPPPPGPALCGFDVTTDELGCAEFEACP